MARIPVLTVLVGVAAAVALTAPVARARGGGAHYVFIPIFIPGHAGPAQPFTPNAGVDLPLEVTDRPVQRQDGVVGLHEAIAQHEIRAADAIIIDQAIEGGRREIPAGSALAKVVLTRDGSQTVLWCDMRRYDGLGTSRFDCFSDQHGSGELDGRWASLTSDEFLGFGGDEDISFKGPMNSAVPFHAAKPGERPSGLIGYEWCGGDVVKSPPRFEVSASFSGGYWEESETHACPFGQWTDAAKTTVHVDTVDVEVRPGPKPNTLFFKVDGRIAPELIAHLEPGGPIRARAAALADQDDYRSALTEQSLTPIGTPASAASGEIEKGSTLFSIEVRHAVTGVLTNDIWTGKYAYFTQAPPPETPGLRAGQIVYARTVTTAQEAQLVWCAPRKSEGGTWKDAVCLPKDGTGYVWTEAQPALLVGPLVIPATLRPYATPPTVERRPVDLPAMTLSYIFKGWTNGAANIEAQIDGGDGPRTFRSSTVKFGPDGAAKLPVFGGAIVLRLGAITDDANVEYRATESSVQASIGHAQ